MICIRQAYFDLSTLVNVFQTHTCGMAFVPAGRKAECCEDIPCRYWGGDNARQKSYIRLLTAGLSRKAATTNFSG
jgi:hypothetical protein